METTTTFFAVFANTASAPYRSYRIIEAENYEQAHAQCNENELISYSHKIREAVKHYIDVDVRHGR